LGYCVGSLIVASFFIVTLAVMRDPWAQFAATSTAVTATFLLTVGRLQNLGMSGWWSLLLLVPIANVLLNLRCLAFPAGYADHRTMDVASKRILASLVLLMGASVVLTILVALISPERAGQPGPLPTPRPARGH
jgi:uncharacterized membrane protein YhaH (DUF805 family)